MVNATTDEVYVALLSIDEGHTYDDLVAHVAKEQARSEVGKPALGPPAWVIAADDGDTAPGGRSELSAGATAGTYGIVCATSKANSGSIWAAGSFTVSE